MKNIMTPKNQSTSANVLLFTLLIMILPFSGWSQWTDAGVYLHPTNNEQGIRLGNTSQTDGGLVIQTYLDGMRVYGNTNVHDAGSILMTLESDSDLRIGALYLDNPGSSDQLYVNDELALSYSSGSDYLQWGGISGTDLDYNVFSKPICIGGITAPASDVAIQTIGGKEIKMVGNNSYIQYFKDGNALNNPSGFIGGNQVGGMFLESNEAAVNIDGETEINFLISDVLKLTLDASGNLGIGTNSPDPYKLQVAGDADITGELTAASDARLKDNIVSIDADILDQVMQLRPVSYTFKTEEFPELDLADRQKMGFLAQELEEIFPNLVSIGGEVVSASGESFKSKSVNYIELIPVLTKAIQMQQTMIEEQQTMIAIQAGQLAELKNSVERFMGLSPSKTADE